MIRKTISWTAYGCSSLLFLYLFSHIFWAGSAYVVAVNALLFAPAGFVSLGIRNLAFNLTMAVPAAFIVDGEIVNWSHRSEGWYIEGSVWLITGYCLLGMIAAVVCLFYLWVRRSGGLGKT